MDLRLQLITEYLSDLFSMAELTAQYGISRKTGYKWVERYRNDGAVALFDQSRRPDHSPHATPSDLVAALVAVRHRHPRWGAKKLLATVKRQRPDAPWPSRATVCDLLKRRGLVQPARRPRRPPHGAHVLTPMTRPNEVWTTDFKGEFRTGDRRYC